MSKLKFNINLAAGTKTIRNSNKFVKASKLLEAIIILDGEEFKARLSSTPVEESLSEFRVLPLTPNSFKLQDKIYVFLKDKDIYGHNQIVIRDKIEAHVSPGLDTQYNVFIENMIINGYIVKKDNRYYFDYKDLVAFRENGHRIIERKINYKNE